MEFNKFIIAAFVAGLLIELLLINQDFVGQPAFYNVGACTFQGNKTCGSDITWDGICTPEIEDECCTPIRQCEGFITEDPYSCETRYCYENGKKCVAEYQIEGNYECKCVTAQAPL